MNATQPAPLETSDSPSEPPPPACVLCFNANDPSGACGLAGDTATISAMGAFALPVVTALWMRDSAEIFDQVAIDDEHVVEQARTVLEDINVSGFKLGFLGSAENVAAIAEIVSDYAELPLVAYMPDLSWLDEDQLAPYLEAYRELILPAAELLVGNHKTLTDLLLPDWDSERPPSARELAAAAGERGTRFVLVTGIVLPTRGNEQSIDNVLASPQGALAGEKFERFEAGFVGAGETLSASLAALLAAGSELQAAVGEALAFLDQSLDAGFRPGMGNVVPDRFFWALPEPQEGDQAAAGDASADGASSPGPSDSPGSISPDDTGPSRGGPRRVH
jgi:hydroxymethylpyrimidine/phosphomethylpyrimidine kinase